MITKEEKQLRQDIREMIRVTKRKRLQEQKAIEIEEQKLRSIIRDLLILEAQVSDTDPTPNKSTGINILEDLLKKIVPVLETDYKIMTTDPEQRKSFRAHVIQAIINTLTPVEMNTKAGNSEEDLEEEISIEIEDDEANPESDKFIDIRSDAEKAEEEEPEDPRKEFGIEGQDETGRNIAYSCFKKIETNIIDAYELLSNAEDQELFYDYLITNVKLYFDKFEKELDPGIEEPSNQAYDMAKQDLEQPTEDEVDLGLD